MDVCAKFRAEAKKDPRRIVFPEPQDDRVVAALKVIVTERIAKPVLVGRAAEIEAARRELGELASAVQFVVPADSADLERYAGAYVDCHPTVRAGAARRILERPLFFAGQMVAAGDAEGMVAGVANTTAMVISSSATTVGYAPGINSPSSIFIMQMPDGLTVCEPVLVFADAAVNIQPTVQELAEIAVVSARSARDLLGIEPRVAMLSFSTRGSGVHPDSLKVAEATRIARVLAPDLAIDGEMQADAALVPSVAKRKKLAGSPVGGRANVLIFPDLDAGNIAYKLVQWLGGAKAIGPFLQGFAKPMTDMSRGATVDDIVTTAAVSVVKAQKGKR